MEVRSILSYYILYLTDIMTLTNIRITRQFLSQPSFQICFLTFLALIIEDSPS